MSVEVAESADSIEAVRERLEEFRLSHALRSRLPEELWQAAAEQARRHGVHAVAHALRLDYEGLKKRLGGTPRERVEVRSSQERDAAHARQPATFVELRNGVGARAGEYTVEFESGTGLRMRVRWVGTQPEWSSLLQAWREVAR